MSDDLETGRTTPPKDEEWASIWKKLDRADSLSSKAWVIVGPIYAVVTNWKALGLIIAGVAWLNRPEIIAALTTIAGG